MGGAEMGEMMAMMGGNVVQKYVAQGWENYQQMKLLGITRQQMARNAAEPEDQEMTEPN